MEKNKNTTRKNAISRGEFIKKTAIAMAGFYIERDTQHQAINCT